MTSVGLKVRVSVVVVAAVVAIGLIITSTALASPIKEALESHIGWEVDKSTKGKVCTSESKHECQLGAESSAPGGFSFPHGVAADDSSDPAHHGHIYIADTDNDRVQELTATGEFVSMFGWDVNKTKQEKEAPQEERNICTAASSDVCQAGMSGSEAGQFTDTYSIAVDPTSGDVYVEDLFNWRIEKFTASGEFILALGKHVNKTTLGNVCTSTEICQAGEREPEGSSEHGAFNFEQGFGNILAIGGPEKRLYVGDEHRVQEFSPLGEWKDEISLTAISEEPRSTVIALTADESGDVYLVYSIALEDGVMVEHSDIVREFDSSKKETGSLHVSAREPNSVVHVGGLAFDQQGLLAVLGQEVGFHQSTEFRVQVGELYDFASAKVITEFFAGRGTGLSFNDQDELFSAVSPTESGHEVLAYKPFPVAELVTGQHSCSPAAPNETKAVFDCVLSGEVNPEGVSETEVWFDWGRTCGLGSQTSKQPVPLGEQLVQVVSPELELRPNEAICYRLAAFDHNVQPPEGSLTGEELSFTAPSVKPVIVGIPISTFVKSSSAVLFGEVNPENSLTEYAFEYGPCEDVTSCATKTNGRNFSTYGVTGGTFEVTGLQPDTRYWYRPMAINDKDEMAEGEGGSSLPLGSFTTARASEPSAETGSASGVGATSAVIAGIVNPDGRAAVYSFEIGIDKGVAIQYGTVFSASAGAGVVVEQEALLLTGLQPGTRYAYRIRLQSGEQTVIGAAAIFTTQGLPLVLEPPSPLPMLSVPKISFPRPVPAPKKKKIKPKKHSKGKKNNVRKRSNKRGSKRPTKHKR